MSAAEKTYNGWTNYETWLLGLWMDNDQGSYDYWREEARECVKRCAEGEGNEFSKPERRPVLLLAEHLKDAYENEASELVSVTGFWADMLNAALAEVNWHEIAEHLIEEAK